MKDAWLALTRLERVVLVTAILIAILTCMISSGVLPRRSITSMGTGLVMLCAMIVEPIFLLCLLAQQLRKKNLHQRRSWPVLLVGLAGSAPAVLLGIRLF